MTLLSASDQGTNNELDLSFRILNAFCVMNKLEINEPIQDKHTDRVSSESEDTARQFQIKIQPHQCDICL